MHLLYMNYVIAETLLAVLIVIAYVLVMVYICRLTFKSMDDCMENYKKRRMKHDSSQRKRHDV